MSDICELLGRIGIRAPKDALLALLSHAMKAKVQPLNFCEELVALELRERDSRNLASRTRVATLGIYKTLDSFDWNHPRSVDRDLYDQLLDLDFVERGENVLFRGPSGVGKTTLAQNLGLHALQKGLTVRFSTVPAALADLLRQESLPATERRLKRYTLPDLLVLDELGYVPCDSRAADLFFHIVSRRHERKAIVVTTNLAFKQWGSVFQDASCLGALVDRFAQHCHVIDIDGDSWRQTNGRTSSPKSSRTRRKPKS